MPDPPAPVAPQPPEDPPADGMDDRTVIAPPRRPRPGWLLVLPDGTRQPIAGTVVVGRRPAKNAFPGADRAIPLADPAGQVSRSHAVFEADEEELWVRDLGSTNGVVVVAPSGEETNVQGDARVRVDVGAEVELGRYVVTIDREGA